jgi:SAM-dependent methyltransferase
MSEIDRIKEAYSVRTHKESKGGSLFSSFIIRERENIYTNTIRNHFNDLSSVKMIEIGAGTGTNLGFFNKLGIPWNNISANELLEERYTKLSVNLPQIQLFKGNAMDMPESISYDLVFQSTVFTSILDKDFKKLLANKIFGILKPGGIILWYDFVYDNPANKDVSGVSRKEIKQLFPESKKITFYPVTLAPPLGRRIGSWYPFFNFVFPFLRTHVIAVIEK